MTKVDSKQIDSQRPSSQTLQSLVIERQREESQLRRIRRG
jgi:hypothetical protein